MKNNKPIIVLGGILIVAVIICLVNQTSKTPASDADNITVNSAENGKSEAAEQNDAVSENASSAISSQNEKKEDPDSETAASDKSVSEEKKDPDNEDETETETDAATDPDVFLYPDEIIVEYIDVGQGDSTLIYDVTTGFSCLIDTGLYEAYDNVQATLADYDIETLDALILTHPDTDHIQSAVDVIKNYSVKSLYMSKAENPDAKAYVNLCQYLDKNPIDVFYPAAYSSLYTGSENSGIIFMAPHYDDTTDLTDTNGLSLIVKLYNGNDSFLFLGDATGDEVDWYLGQNLNPDTTVLKASHHGSANDGCNSLRMFKTLEPEFCVISCGYQNEYGHPHKETMQIIKDMNIKLFRTDLQGSISCKSTGNGIEWNQDPTDVYTNGNGLK